MSELAGTDRSWPARYHIALVMIAIIAASLLLWTLPLFFGRQIMQVDTLTHLRWSFQFITAVEDGVGRPRWAYAAHGGLGEPAFLYYQPALYYVNSLFSTLGLSRYNSFFATAVVTPVLAGTIAFFQLRSRMTPGRALAGAAFLLTSPVMFFIATHSGAFPWAFSLPFCLLLVLAGTKDRPDPLLVAILTATVCLTHLLSGLMVLMAMGLGRLLFAFPTLRDVRGHLQWAAGVALGLCLAAYFVYPALTGMDLINPGGWSTEATLDWHPAMAFPVITYLQYGSRWFALQWPLPAYALFMCVLVLVITKPTQLRPVAGASLARRLAITALVALFLGSELAYPLYAYVAPMRKLQWPYRFVPLALMLASFAFVLVAWPRFPQKRNHWRQVAALSIVGFHCLCVFYLQYNVWTAAKPPPPVKDLMAVEFGQPEYLVSSRGEHWQEYMQTGGLDGECARLAMRCQMLQQSTHSLTLSIEAAQGGVLRLPVFAFPAWETSVDGHVVAALIDKRTGVLAVSYTAGKHLVSTRWRMLPMERTGLMLSLLGAIVVLIAGSTRWLKSRRRKAAMTA